MVVSVTGRPDRVIRVDGPATGTTVTGLRNGVEAKFTVYAVTAGGASKPSETVSAIPITGMEGEVAGIIVAFEPGVSVTDGEQLIPGEAAITNVDLVAAGKIGAEATLVTMSEALTIGEAEKVAQQLEADPKVAWAEPDRFLFTAADPAPTTDLAQAVTVPDDAEYASSQWNLWDTYGIGVGDGATSMTNAWAQGIGEGATVAVIDTGITAHPDLNSQLVPGYDFVSNPDDLAAARTERGPPEAFDADAIDPNTFGAAGWDANPTDPGDWRGVAPMRDSTWHGTKVAGVIAAQARNGEGIAGVAPGAKIQPIRALSWRGGLLSDIAASITWASGGTVDGVTANEHPSDVINLSLSAQTFCPTALQNAIDGARARGSVIVAAAGNANDDAANYAPGNCNGVITVAATDRNGTRAPYSNYGSRIDIAAPGGNLPVDGGIRTTANTGTTIASDPTWSADQGTSLAAAHVSAAAALLKARTKSFPPDDIERTLTGNVRDFVNDTCDADTGAKCGAGILSLAQVALGTCVKTESDVIDSGVSYWLVKFTATGSESCTSDWNVPDGVTSLDQILVVGGGGGGGARVGGGGGGGGVIHKNTSTQVTPAKAKITVTVGKGGLGAQNTTPDGILSRIATSGGSSAISSDFVHLEALGGGHGGSWTYQAAAQGGSGGGGGGGGGTSPNYSAGAAGTTGQGWKGGDGQSSGYVTYSTGGGGGAGGAGGSFESTSKSGNGGSGRSVAITGSDVLFGGGGGGGVHGNTTPAGTPGTGGSGGGGDGGGCTGSSCLYGSTTHIYKGENGEANLGGGGGGSGGPSSGDALTSAYSWGGDGGSGTVIIRYQANWLSLSYGAGRQPGEYTYGTGWTSTTGPKVQLTTAAGELLTDSDVDVTATFTPSGETAQSPFTVKTVQGVADFSAMTIAGDAGTTGTLTFSATGYGSVESSVTVSKALLTVTAAVQSVVYGSTVASVTGAGSVTYSGFKGSDTASVVSGSVSYETSYTSSTPAGTPGVTIAPVVAGLSATNYSFTAASGGVTVTKAALTVTASSPSVAFGTSLNPSFSISSGALIAPDAIDSVTFTYQGTGSTTYASSTTVPTAVGTYSVTPSAAVFTTGLASNYTITYAPGTATISAADQTINFPTVSSKAYGDPTFTVSATASSGLEVTYASQSTSVCRNNGSTVTIVAAGTCVIRATQAGNESFNAAPAVEQTITVGTAPLTITASAASVAFGTVLSPSFEVTAGSLIGTDAIASVSYTYTGTNGTSYGPLSTAPTAVGTYSVRPSAAVFPTGSASNYDITYAASTVTIAKATPTLSWSGQSKTYGDGAFTMTAPISSVSGSFSYASSDTSVATVSGAQVTILAAGSSTITATFTPTESSSYVSGKTVTSVLTVAKAAVTVSASSPSVSFGTALSPTFSVSSGSLVSPDAIGSVTYTYQGTGSTTYASSSVAPTAVGTYSVTPSAAVFSTGLASNYSITYAPGTATISAANQTITFPTVGSKTYGDAAFTVSATASSGQAVTFASRTTSVCTSGGANGATVTIVGAGGCTIRATQAGNASYIAVTSDQTIEVAKAGLTVTASSPSVTYGAAVPVVTAAYSAFVNGESASNLSTQPSCLTTYTTTSNAGSAPSTSCSGAVSANYLFTYVPGAVTIAKATQQALRVTSTSGTYGTAFTLATFGGSTGGSVSYGVTGGIGADAASGCSVTSGVLSSTSSGTCLVTATMAGNDNYEPVSTTATTVTLAARPITIAADDEAIVYGSAISQSYRISAGTLTDSDAITRVTYTYEGTGTTVYGPTTTAPTGGGTYSVTPSAAMFSPGAASSYDITYTPGAVTIGRASQTITFTKPAGRTYLDPPFTLVATASSSLPVAYASSTPDVCTVAGRVVTIVGAGDCTITAMQAGNVNYNAANDVSHTFGVQRASQSLLSMTSASSATYGQTMTLAASGGSGTGSLSFSVTSPSGVDRCALSSSGTTLILGNAGTVCKVQATRAQDANYSLTSSSEQTITILKAGQTLAFTSTVPTAPLPGGTYTPTAAAISTVTGASSGVSPMFTASGTCTITAGIVSFNATGNCIVTADAASNMNFTAAASITQVIAVGSLNQSITFPQPSNAAFGSSGFAAGASASSGLTVTYTLGGGTTNGACSVSTLGAVSILAVGACEVVASQPGNTQYAAASDVNRAFRIEPALATAPTLTSASASSRAITVAFTVPGFTGGVPITAYRIVATPTGVGLTVSSTSCTASPCTITGLANGATYRVTAAAINVAGTGSTSGASTPLTPATSAYAVGALAASPGDTTVALSWTPLTTDQLGGGTFTRYEISRRVAGPGAWTLVTDTLTTQSTNSYTVTGLNNGTSYDFQVVAITTANTSEIAGNTAQVVQYPSTVPSAPQSPVVLASTATDVEFSWMAPLSDGGSALTTPNYSVSVTSSSTDAASVTCTPAGAARSCTASNLTNGAIYEFSVVANNRMGQSVAATKTYIVPSSITTLSSLVVISPAGAVALSPTFSSATTAYAASVAHDVATVMVTPTTTAAGATVKINGVSVTSGQPSAALSLSVGVTSIEIVVTASDPRYSQAYAVSITRAAAPSGGGGASDWVPVPGIPVIPPSNVAAGDAVGAVTQDGEVRQDVVLTRNSTDSGWTVIAEDFTLGAAVRSVSGQPVPLAAGGVMQAPQGGRIEIIGSGYQPDTYVAVFAIPRNPMESRFLTPRTLADAIYLASVRVAASGQVAGEIPVPRSLAIGDYVLQLNGVSDENTLRSVNLLLDVKPAPQPRAGVVVRSAFFSAKSARISLDGMRKVSALVGAVPRNATAVNVSVAAVSVSLGTPEANLALARERAVSIVKELRARGVTGDYTVSVTTTFSVDAGDAQAQRGSLAARSLQSATPIVDASGKPLSTVSISYVSPPTGVV